MSPIATLRPEPPTCGAPRPAGYSGTLGDVERAPERDESELRAFRFGAAVGQLALTVESLAGSRAT